MEDNDKLLMECMPVFYNLHGRTLDDVQKAADLLEKTISINQLHIDRVTVDVYSNFRGAWTVEIDIFRGGNDVE